MTGSSYWSKTRAGEWYKTEEEFLELCRDAVRQARTEGDQEMAHDSLKRAQQYKLETHLSDRQLVNLCRIADHVVPPRRS